MPRLKSRQRFLPGGFPFYQPQTKWQGPQNVSFDTVVNAIISHRLGQPAMTAQYGLSTDYNTVADELDVFAATWAKSVRLNDFVVEGGGEAAIPFHQAHQPMNPIDQNKLSAAAHSVKAIWQGIKTIADWITSGAPAVPAEQSASRAAVCVTCPKNDQGDFTKWFTLPASEAIRRQLDQVKDRNLSTPDDAKLNICSVCMCPMRLKVHLDIVFINAHLNDETRAALKAVTNPSGGCWIPKEIWPV